MSVIEYETMFHALTRHELMILPIKEKIHEGVDYSDAYVFDEFGEF